MSYADIINSNGTQMLQLPREYRFDTDHVSIEQLGDGLLIKPVKEQRPKLTLEQLFAMLDETQREEGLLDLDDLDAPPPQEREVLSA